MEVSEKTKLLLVRADDDTDAMDFSGMPALEDMTAAECYERYAHAVETAENGRGIAFKDAFRMILGKDYSGV